MRARVTWAGDLTFVGYGETLHGVVMDGGKGDGGLGVGASPMEMLLMGTGSCASIDVIMILKKARQNVTDCVVELEAERADEPPRKFTGIHMHFKVTGDDLSEKHVERAIELSVAKYCSAAATMTSAIDLSHDFEIIEAG